LSPQKIRNPARKFSEWIEMNKDYQAYSDFKEGINKGLDIAKGTFEENLEKFLLFDSEEYRDVKINNLQSTFNTLIDEINLTKKPNCSNDRFEGIYTGFEKSKQIFRDFLEMSL